LIFYALRLRYQSAELSPGEKVRKKAETISLIRDGEASGKMILEAPRKKIEICCCIE
jgi:hypothetical protein